MPWYQGSSLLHHLEEVHIASDRNLIDPRFAVQYVLRPLNDDHHDYRGYAGQVSAGIFKPGDSVMVLPSGFTTRVASIDTADGPIDEAFPPMSVSLRLEDDIELIRDAKTRPTRHRRCRREILDCQFVLPRGEPSSRDCFAVARNDGI